jgi:hypothetical protein
MCCESMEYVAGSVEEEMELYSRCGRYSSSSALCRVS